MGRERLRKALKGAVALAALAAPWLAGPAASRTPPEDRNLTALPAPPFRQHLSAPDRRAAIHPLKLEPLGAKPNRIADGDEWFGANGLALPAYEVPNPFQNKPGDLPEFVPERFGDQRLVKAIRCPDAVLLVYGADFSGGRYLVALDPASGDFLYGFDFIHYSRSPKSAERDRAFVDQAIRWAWQEDRVLYVSHAHGTYASASGGSNAYITALDTATGAVLWRSQPLVSNAARPAGSILPWRHPRSSPSRKTSRARVLGAGVSRCGRRTRGSGSTARCRAPRRRFGCRTVVLTPQFVVAPSVALPPGGRSHRTPCLSASD